MGTVAAAVLLSGLWIASMNNSAVAQEKELRTVNVNVFREDAATLVGRVHGFFPKEGLRVNVTQTANSTDQMRGLSNGTYQIASTAFDNVLGWSGRENAELIAVSQIIDKAIYPVFVRPEIKDWNGLRGKKLAVDAVDTAFALVLRKVLLAHGLDLARGDYEIVAVGNTPLRFESMKRGETFGAILTAPVDAQAAAAGMIRLGDSNEVLPDFPNTIFAASRAWGESHRTALVGFLRAWLSSMHWIRVNKDEATRLVSEDLKVTPNVAAGRIAELSATGAIDPAALERALALRNQFGMTPKMGPAASKYYDLQYYKAAAGQ